MTTLAITTTSDYCHALFLTAATLLSTKLFIARECGLVLVSWHRWEGVFIKDHPLIMCQMDSTGALCKSGVASKQSARFRHKSGNIWE